MRPRHLLATAIAPLLVATVATGCSDGDESSTASTTARRSKLCSVYDSIDWHRPSPTIEDSIEDVGADFARLHDQQQRLADAATGSLADDARQALAIGDRVRAKYLAERSDAGGGTQLRDRAFSRGYDSVQRYIDSFSVGPDTEDVIVRRRFAIELARSCGGLRLPTGDPLTDATAPPGEILAVRSNTAEIHRFSTAGTDLGQLTLPGVPSPIVSTSLSPDRTRLSFLAGTTDHQLWVLDLRTGALTSETAAGCPSWNDNTTLWASVGPPGSSYLARITTDGNYDPASRIDELGCAFRLDSTHALVHRAPVDGAPVEIDRITIADGTIEPLVATTCNVISPSIAPDRRHLVVNAGCAKEVESGVYITNVDGSHRHHLVKGSAASPVWSPDGGWITYSGYDADHPGDQTKLRVYVASTDGATVGVVTPPGYSWPVWLPAPPA